MKAPAAGKIELRAGNHAACREDSMFGAIQIIGAHDGERCGGFFGRLIDPTVNTGIGDPVIVWAIADHAPTEGGLKEGAGQRPDPAGKFHIVDLIHSTLCSLFVPGHAKYGWGAMDAMLHPHLGPTLLARAIAYGMARHRFTSPLVCFL
jgi:hypothetical protein